MDENDERMIAEIRRGDEDAPASSSTFGGRNCWHLLSGGWVVGRGARSSQTT